MKMATLPCRSDDASRRVREKGYCSAQPLKTRKSRPRCYVAVQIGIRAGLN